MSERIIKPFATRAEVDEYLGGETIQCLECGKHYRILSGKHLRLVHGTTPDEYRERWGLPWGAPLAGLAVRRQRSEIIKRSIEDGRLTHDHLAAAGVKGRSIERRARSAADTARRSALAREIRPGDHGRLPAGARRADGRDADRAREYQREYRRKRAARPA